MKSIRAAFWVIFGRLSGMAAFLLGNIVLARALKPEEFGVYLFAANIASTGAIIACMGTNRSIVRFLAEELASPSQTGLREIILRLSKLFIFGMILVGVAIGIVAPLIGSLIGWVSIPPLTWVLTAGFTAVLSMHLFAAETLRGFQEQKIANLLSGQTGGVIFTCLALVIFGVVARFLPASANVVLACYMLAGVLMLPLVRMWLRQTYREGLSSSMAAALPTDKRVVTTRELMTVSLNLLSVQFFAYVMVLGDIILAGIMVSPTDLALYGVSRRISNLVTIPMQLAMMTLSPVIPTLFKQDRMQELQRQLSIATMLSTAPAAVAFLILTVAPSFVLGTIFGDYYRAAATITTVVSAGQFAFAVLGMAPLILMMTGKHHVVNVVYICSSVAAIVSCLIGASLAGSLGLAIAFTSVMIAQAVVLAVLLLRLYGLWTVPSFAAFSLRTSPGTTSS